MESEFIQGDIARVAPRGVRVGGKAVDDRSVGEPYFQLLDQRAFEKARLAGARQNPARLGVFLHLFHQQPGLPLAFGEEYPGCLSLQAFEQSANGGRKGITDLAGLHHDLEV